MLPPRRRKKVLKESHPFLIYVSGPPGSEGWFTGVEGGVSLLHAISMEQDIGLGLSVWGATGLGISGGTIISACYPQNSFILPLNKMLPG